MNWRELTIREIESYLSEKPITEETLEELLKDNRAGVIALAERYRKQLAKEQERIARWKERDKIENTLRNQGYRLIAGIDEAGRGPLAGPVVAAAVILNPKRRIIGLEDSKKLSEKERERLFKVINEEAMAVGIGIIDNRTIDRFNILQAALMAMKKALSQLEPSPDYVLVDGNREIPDISVKQQAIVDGDRKVNAIAAASIVAKVTRDRMLLEYHKEYPAYGFDQHKGYGTSQHIQALKNIGPCPLHRFTFSVVKKYHFLHIKNRIIQAETQRELKELGETIASDDFLSAEYLQVLRELYKKQYYKIAVG